MKRKISIALVVFSLIFLASGYYVITTIQRATRSLDDLLMLHQVEIVREHLLIQVKKTQFDLHLKDTRFARSIDTIVAHVASMSEVVNTCFECHHAADVAGRLEELRHRIEQYKDSLSRVLTIRANRARLAAEEDMAYRLGAEITAEISSITGLTNRKLQERTRAALEQIGRMKNLLYLILIMTPLVVLGISLRLLRGFMKPVASLIKATRRLQEGDLSYRLEGLHDEYGEVAASFNKMAQSLKEHWQRMQWAEQVVVLGELAGGLAHEIKNPLAGIKASMEVLSQDPSILPENKDVLYKVSEQVKRMEGLIRSFMNFARPPAPQFTVTDMHSVLDSTIGLAQRHPLFAQGRPQGIAIVKEYDRRVPALTADPTQMQQVFLNLLLNAAEAMPEGGTVTVQTVYDSEADAIMIRIRDTGKGVDEVVRDKIFQPFFTTKAKGTGLGLAISKRLVEQHGGSIRLESVTGAGSAFLITLPVPVMAEVPVP